MPWPTSGNCPAISAAPLAGVAQPVLLIADPHDTLIPVSTTHRLAAVLPDARVQLVEGIGHHLPRRAAPQIAAAIVQFLADRSH